MSSMKQRRVRFWSASDGNVSLYFMLMLLPLLFFFGLLIDVLRYKAADQEAELAVKAGIRSVMASFSRELQAYGLFALEKNAEDVSTEFETTTANNLSLTASVGEKRFVWIDQKLESGRGHVTTMYPLSSHQTLKRQILEEMKYRAPIIFALELADKWRNNGVASTLGNASQFGERAARVEALIEERDDRLDEAWDSFSLLQQKGDDITPFYQSQLRGLNELSEKIGVHTLEETKQSLEAARSQVSTLQEHIRSIDGSLMSLAKAGAGAAQAIAELSRVRSELMFQLQSAEQTIAQYVELLNNFTKYAELLLVIQAKTTLDQGDIQSRLQAFQTVFQQAVQANDRLNEELIAIRSAETGSSSMSASNQVFAQVTVLNRQDLDEWEASISASAAQFAGFHAQMHDGIWFTSPKYGSTLAAVEGFHQKLQTASSKIAPIVDKRKQSRKAVKAAKKNEREKTQAVLDQVRRGLGACSIMSGVDPYEPLYQSIEGDAATKTKGYAQIYMGLNQEPIATSSIPMVPLDRSDQAGLQALKLAASLEQLLTDVRDEFYIDEFAVSKFSYRTLGLEKDAYGSPRTSKELSSPENHPLMNQEVEYLIYGSDSCASNYSFAYAEMFAFRLAVGVTEALLEPRNEALAAGSPLLVLLTAITEGAIRAQDDMAKLVQGDLVPVSRKLSQAITMSYKDYLRVFLLLHSREAALLSRIQALIQLNTGIDLAETSTYASGRSHLSFRFWFMSGVMKQLGKSGFAGCSSDSGSRCIATKTAELGY